MDLKKCFIGGSKKRELSNSSTNGDDQKLQESNLNYSQNVHDIFSKGLFSPNCVAILGNCIKKLEHLLE